jgi:hypothetical protein
VIAGSDLRIRGSRKVRTPQGRTLGQLRRVPPNEATEAAKADGKWNRKETAGPGNRVGKGETVG